MSDRPRGRARGGQGGAEPRRRIRARELQVLDLLVAGRSQHQIAASLGITQPAVSKIARRIEERLLSDFAYKVERQRARQTLQLQHIYAESMDAWQASKQDAVRRRQRKTDPAGGAGTTMAEVVAELQHGDPRYLEIARKALADLRDVWGVDATDRIEMVTPYATMTDAAIAAELGVQERLLRLEPLTVNPAAPSVTVPTVIDVTQEDSDGHC
jgi:hypothetical protein